MWQSGVEPTPIEVVIFQELDGQIGSHCHGFIGIMIASKHGSTIQKANTWKQNHLTNFIWFYLRLFG